MSFRSFLAFFYGLNLSTFLPFFIVIFFSANTPEAHCWKRQYKITAKIIQIIATFISIAQSKATDSAFLGWLLKDVYIGVRVARPPGLLAHSSAEQGRVSQQVNDHRARFCSRWFAECFGIWRPTKAVEWWEGGDILGGRDELAGGTWLACSRGGRVAFLTNVLEIDFFPDAKSRGDLPVLFLKVKTIYREHMYQEKQYWVGFLITERGGSKGVRGEAGGWRAQV